MSKKPRKIRKNKKTKKVKKSKLSKKLNLSNYQYSKHPPIRNPLNHQRIVEKLHHTIKIFDEAYYQSWGGESFEDLFNRATEVKRGGSTLFVYLPFRRISASGIEDFAVKTQEELPDNAESSGLVVPIPTLDDEDIEDVEHAQMVLIANLDHANVEYAISGR